MKRKAAEKRGSYTVEASVLMGIILTVLVSIIYLGFYCHDLGFLQGAAHETACYASLHKDDKNRNTRERAAKLVRGRLFGIREVSTSVSEGKEVQVTYSGNFRLPGMIRAFFGRDGISTSGKVTLHLERPSAKIQKIRGIIKIGQSIRDGVKK